MRTAPNLSELEKNERYEWCLQNRNNNFDNYLFIDESKIDINICQFYHSRLRNTYPTPMNITSNRRGKLNLWAGISRRGATPIVV